MRDLQDRTLIERIAYCYHTLAGEPLPCPDTVDDRADWLDKQAPYSLLAHGNTADPCFIYANHTALDCFGYTREAFLRLPSRLSAASPDRQARQLMLQRLATEGIVYGYSGERIPRQGEPFTIYNGVIWQLTDDKGIPWGQGALFWLSPEASLHSPARSAR